MRVAGSGRVRSTRDANRVGAWGVPPVISASAAGFAVLLNRRSTEDRVAKMAAFCAQQQNCTRLHRVCTPRPPSRPAFHETGRGGKGNGGRGGEEREGGEGSAPDGTGSGHRFGARQPRGRWIPVTETPRDTGLARRTWGCKATSLARIAASFQRAVNSGDAWYAAENCGDEARWRSYTSGCASSSSSHASSVSEQKEPCTAPGGVGDDDETGPRGFDRARVRRTHHREMQKKQLRVVQSISRTRNRGGAARCCESSRLWSSSTPVLPHPSPSSARPRHVPRCRVCKHLSKVVVAR